MKFQLTLETERILAPYARETFESYLKGNITAREACIQLKWTRPQFERHLAGIFNIALNGNDREIAHIQRI